jgi:hypothetical protein
MGAPDQSRCKAAHDRGCTGFGSGLNRAYVGLGLEARVVKREEEHDQRG